ncbi:hypothetical protein B1B_02602, partial [mine drainage metagenome]
MNGSIVIFGLRKDMNATEKNEFCHYFYGHNTSSWKGKYRYHRHGLLDDIPHRKIAKGVIIIRSEDLERVKEYVKEKVEEIHIRTVVLNEDDID